MAHIYDSVEIRNKHFQMVSLGENIVHRLYYKYRMNQIDYTFCGLEFDVSDTILKFAYNLAVWKEPEVIDKPDYPPRTKEERVYDIFLGNVTECLTYLYLHRLGVKDLHYYDLERVSNKYNKSLDYDIKLGDRPMSLKLIPTTLEDEHYVMTDMVIRGDKESNNTYYTQFLTHRKDGSNAKTYYKNYIQDILEHRFDLVFMMLGGVVNINEIVYKDLAIRYNGRNPYRYILFKEEFSAENYMQNVLKNEGVDFKGCFV